MRWAQAQLTRQRASRHGSASGMVVARSSTASRTGVRFSPAPPTPFSNESAKDRRALRRTTRIYRDRCTATISVVVLGSVGVVDACGDLMSIATVCGAWHLGCNLGPRGGARARAKGKRVTMPDGTVQVAAKSPNGRNEPSISLGPRDSIGVCQAKRRSRCWSPRTA